MSLLSIFAQPTVLLARCFGMVIDRMLTFDYLFLQELNDRQFSQLWSDASKLCIDALAVLSSTLGSKNHEMPDIEVGLLTNMFCDYIQLNIVSLHA